MKRNGCIILLLATVCTFATPLPADASSPHDTAAQEMTGASSEDEDAGNADSDSDSEVSPLGNRYEIWGWNVPLYYFYLYKHLFAGYPWVVRVAYGVVIVCCLGFLLLVITMSVDIYLRRRNRKKYDELRKQYLEKLIDVCLAKTENLPTDEISRRIDYKSKKWKRWELRQWTYIFIEVSTHTNTLNPNLTNIQRAMRLVGINDYVEKRLAEGKQANKVRVIQAVRLTNMELPNSTMAHLLNNKHVRLRRAARLYYMGNSQIDPFYFFEHADLARSVFSIWDKMEMHEVFFKINDAGKPVPSFLPLLQKMEHTDLVAFFIKEVAYWGKDNDMEFLFQYFNAHEFAYREAAFVSMGIRKFKAGEEGMKKVYHKQTEQLRRCILHALLEIQSGKSIPFFTETYEKAASDYTRRTALRCLWLSGAKGRTSFLRLKAQAKKEDQLLFQHVESPIINNDAP